MSSCAEVVGPIWRLGGESIACALPAAHVFADDPAARLHRCGCGCTTWVDAQQLAEADTPQSWL